MKAMLATLTSKGQVTLPKDVREQLGVSVHDKVEFLISDDGTVRVQNPKYTTVASLVGAAGTLEKPLPWEAMRQIAREDHLAPKTDTSL